MSTRLGILILIFILFGITVSLLLCIKNKDDFYYSGYYRPYGFRFDPEIYEKSGGMAAYSSYPVDTSPEGGGYINYPFIPYTNYYPVNYYTPYDIRWRSYYDQPYYLRNYYDLPYLF